MSNGNKVTFYHHPYSRARIAHWMLEECGAEYEIKHVDFKKGDNKTPDFLSVNPMGKLPTIVHRGHVVTEAAAICTYLADAFPESRLAPEVHDPMRGDYYRWLFFAATNIEPAMMDRKFPRVNAPPASSVGYGNYDYVFNTLEKAMQNGDWILGSKFSAADVYIGSSIWYGFMIQEIDKRDTFKRYLSRCEQRPAFQRFTKQFG